MDFLRTNSFKIVGRLMSANLVPSVSKKGDGYISGSATVVSNMGGVDNTFEVHFYTSQKTKDGKESQLYLSYSKMSDLVGKKVQIDGELRESRVWSKSSNQMASSQQLSGRFVRGMAESSIDEATFELGGFIVDELKERTNKEGEIYRYDVAIGQANYKGDMMSKFVLHVNPSDREIVNGVRNYQAGQTVKVNGNLNFIVKVVTSTAKNEGGFGEGVTRTFTNKISNYFIQGGSSPITDAAQGSYPSDVIRSLVSAYKAHDAEIMSNAKDSSPAPVEESSVVTARQTSLI